MKDSFLEVFWFLDLDKKFQQFSNSFFENIWKFSFLSRMSEIAILSRCSLDTLSFCSIYSGNMAIWKLIKETEWDLEQRQNKNDSIQSKMIPILKFSRFFPHRLGGEKARTIQSWNHFWVNGVVLTLSLL